MHTHARTIADGSRSCYEHHGHNGIHGESTRGHTHDGLAAFDPDSEEATARIHIAAPALLAAAEQAAGYVRTDWLQRQGADLADCDTYQRLIAAIEFARGT